MDDLRKKAHLNRQQMIGLNHYDDLQKRIPRDEVAEIEKIVKIKIVNSLILKNKCFRFTLKLDW